MSEQRPWYVHDRDGNYGEGITDADWYNEDWGVGYIVMRQRDGEWEYAFVDWRYCVPSLSFVLRSGKRYEEQP